MPASFIAAPARRLVTVVPDRAPHGGRTGLNDPMSTAPGSARTSARAWAVLGAMGFGALIAQMFTTVIGPALPTIQQDLGLSLSMQTWTITAYSLAFGAGLVAGGRLGDIVGEVRMIVIGFVVFGAGLFMSAIATGGALMISGRAIQGIGIGISAPATLSIVVNTFPAVRRGFAVGIWGFAHGFGLLIGPIFASEMMTVASWRGVFWVALPLTALVIIVTLIATRGYRSVLAPGGYDVLGLVIGGVGITAVTVGLQNASKGWGSPATWAPLIIGIVLLVVFVKVEMRSAHPLVDPALFRSRIFSGSFLSESVVGFIYIPMLTFVGSLYFITVLGMTPVEASWVIVITTGTCMLLQPLAGRLVDRIGPGIPVVLSLVMQGVALIWMVTFTPETTLSQLVIPLALMGAGVGIALPACNTGGMSAVSTEQAGMGSGLMQMTFNIPAALGVALVTSLVGTLTATRVESALAGDPSQQDALAYSEALESGDPTGATSILQPLPQATADLIHQTVTAAQASTIALSMLVLGIIALAGAVMAAAFLGLRRMPIRQGVPG